MELTLKSLHDDRDAFLAAGYHLPEFDYDTVHKNLSLIHISEPTRH